MRGGIVEKAGGNDVNAYSAIYLSDHKLLASIWTFICKRSVKITLESPSHRNTGQYSIHVTMYVVRFV